jgi:hypothetical protein
MEKNIEHKILKLQKFYKRPKYPFAYRNIYIGVIAFLVIFIAFLIGRSSSLPSSKSTPINPVISTNQIATTTQKTEKQNIEQAPKNTNNSITNNETNITNNPACLAIANQAALADNEKYSGKQEFTVLRAYFNSSTNNCYYELRDKVIDPEYPSTTISINYAPNDQAIAFCTTIPNSPTGCYQTGYGSISQQTFNLLEAQYLW